MEQIGQTLANVMQKRQLTVAMDRLDRIIDRWSEVEKDLKGLFPNVEPALMDVLWNADVIDLVQCRLNTCKVCMAPGECVSPLLPVVARSERSVPSEAPVGRLTVQWLRCRQYQDWAEERKKTSAAPAEGGGRKYRRGRTYHD